MNAHQAHESSVAGTSATVQVRELRADQDSVWDDYVNRHPHSTFFHRAGWKRIIEQAFGHRTFYLYALQNDVVVGILPLAQVKSWIFGNTLSSLPFCVYGGPLADSADIRDQLVNKARLLAVELGVDSLELRHRETLYPGWPQSSLYVTFRKEIDPDPERNLQNIPRKQRAMVRKGIQAGLTCEWDSDVGRFYSAYSQSVHALGTPVFSRRYFDLLRTEFADACRILTVMKGDQLVASVMSFYFRDEVLPYYGGGTAAARELKGNDFMYWELMRRSCEDGVRIFDYGRSKLNTGSYSFKVNWGFEPQPLHYEYCLVKADDIPNINPLNPKYRLFIAMWKKLPLAASKALGPRLVKYLG